MHVMANEMRMEMRPHIAKDYVPKLTSEKLSVLLAMGSVWSNTKTAQLRFIKT